MSKIIKRSFCAEMRAVENTEQTNEMIVEGYALRFNEDTVIGQAPWGWIESIKREAMNSADISDVVLNMNHDDSKLVARTLNKSLELIVDDVGLKIRGVIANTQTGRDFYELVKNGLITTMSFCAYVKNHNGQNLLMKRWTGVISLNLDVFLMSAELRSQLIPKQRLLHQETVPAAGLTRMPESILKKRNIVNKLKN